MLDTLDPSLVAGIQRGQTILHAVGDWNVWDYHFNAMVEEVCASLALQNLTELLAIATFVSGVWDRRDFAATCFKEGVMKVAVV